MIKKLPVLKLSLRDAGGLVIPRPESKDRDVISYG